jgi:hypothetical protein
MIVVWRVPSHSSFVETLVGTSIDIWSIVVRVISIGLHVEFATDNSKFIHRESLRSDGTVVAGQQLIEDTTVYTTIWAGDDPGARKAPDGGVLGSASVSKDVATFRTFSSDDPLGRGHRHPHSAAPTRISVNSGITWPWLMCHGLTFSFGCVGPSLARPRPVAPEFVLQGANINLSIVRFGINFKL